MSDFIQACTQANREIEKLLRVDFDPTLLQKYNIGEGGDVSLDADLEAEKIFVRHLSSFGTIESEESGVIGEGEKTIIIDPLDGSSNFANRFPYYGTSVALLDENGMLEAAQVCNLCSGDLFTKRDSSLKVENIFFASDDIENNSSEVSLGLFEKAYEHPLVAAALLESGYKFRSPGAVALSLAYSHSVKFFLFVGRSRIYDIVAGLAICEGLEVIVEEDYVIVSQDKNIAKDIESIVRRSI